MAHFHKIVSTTLLLSLLGLAPATKSMEYATASVESVTNHPVAAALTVGAAGLTATVTYRYNEYRKNMHWPWPHINTALYHNKSISGIFAEHDAKIRAQYNERFRWGVGTSAHQVEGNCTNNNWYQWSQEPKQKEKGIVDAGMACDHWNLYPQDIKWMAEHGINTYRFSVEWSKVMPRPGVIDHAVLDHYADVCRMLREHGINPCITLFHYTEPLWFYQTSRTVPLHQFPHLKSLAAPDSEEITLTGWEDEQNIRYFVQFCQAVFERLHPYVDLWLTFNSPEGHAMQGWFSGGKPPEKKNMQLAVEVLKNLLIAHVQTYRALKQMPGGPQAKIGMLKNIYQLHPYNYFNLGDQLACKMGNDLQNESIFNFFRTGTFSVWVPGKASLFYSNEYVAQGNKVLDFIGLNYYSHCYMKMFAYENGKLKTFVRTRDIVNEIPVANEHYTIYAEGFYAAIKELSDRVARPLNIPIYVTENGIGIESDETRELFHQRYLYALAKAIEDGYDVRGYIVWSLMDNYEWGYYMRRYGILHVDFNSPRKTRTLKKGAHYFLQVLNEAQGKKPVLV